ncbi:MAG: SPOR domain-containing protein [Bacteroidaceae bacterium]|nr:SPOR domain-containing protein [Bacteroidaceae bacterium]
MRTLLVLSFLLIQAAFSILGAQTFTQKLTTKTKGSVTLHQDQRLTDIINGVNTISSDNSQTGKKIKARGYRIQVHFGGSSHADKAKAAKAGNDVTKVFPELQSYIKYESPNYRCTVGDFTTKEDAEEYLNKIKEAGLGRNAMVVRHEIIIYQAE